MSGARLRQGWPDLGEPDLRCIDAGICACAVALASLPPMQRAQAGEICPSGGWADVMVGSYHIHPDRHFDDFNPGAGLECSITPRWAATAGYFRNSLDRPSFYAGAIATPEFAHFGWLQLGAMGGIISGYNYGQIGLGRRNRTGPLLAPAAIAGFGRFAANVILIPPISSDDLPFTVGLQLKYRFHRAQ